MKENPITIGFDDVAFNLKSNTKTTKLIGVICQGTRIMKAVKTDIVIDGSDGTEKIINLIKKNEKHVQFILTHSITFGGFNIIDLEEIYSELKKPIIAITEKKVDIDAVINALENKFPNKSRDKIQLILNAGDLFEMEIQTAGGISRIYIHVKGMEIENVHSLLLKVCIDSKLPECIRIAHLIGRLF
ncbi:MAG: endonuclease dU [Promethearchaeota archaeon]|jgi:endonuclease V-like protein UPF0215 family